MAQKKAHEVELFLKNKPQSYSAALIYGPDKGLVAEYSAVFAENCGADSSNAFAFMKMEGELIDKDPSRLIDEAQTISFFGGKRLLWVNYSGGGAKGGLSEALNFLLQQPLADCCILIEAGDLKKSAALRKIIEESPQAVALPCYSDEGKAMQNLINTVLAQFNCAISEEARRALQENLGADRLISRGELEKLCLYAGKGANISVEDVINAVSDGGALAQDSVNDAILGGDIQGFNRQFDRHISSGAAPFLILSSLMRQFQQIQNLRFQMEKEGKTAFAAMAAAKPPLFYKRKKIIEQALAIWTGEKIAKSMARLQKTVLDSRRNSDINIAIIRQNLLALTLEAARGR